MNYIFGEETFSTFYRSLRYEERAVTWIFFVTDRNEKIYLHDWKDWLTVQEYCITKERNIKSVGLRFKGNHINVDVPDNARGVYLIRSARGQMGFESKKTITIGIVEGDLVYKTHWMIPELIEDLKFTDDVESCYKPAIVYNAKKS